MKKVLIFVSGGITAAVAICAAYLYVMNAIDEMVYNGMNDFADDCADKDE